MSDMLGRVQEQSPRIAATICKLAEDLMRQGVEREEAIECAESVVARAIIFDHIAEGEREPWE